MTAEHSLPDILTLASEHGLDLVPDSLHIIEMGLDFRVVIARDTAGQHWVLRIPRSPAVMQRAEVEGRLLAVVAQHLDLAVPDWRIHSPELIAYPLLAGQPGLEVDDGGSPVWHADVSSPTYARSFGTLLAQLHTIPVDELAGTGVMASTPQQVRAAWGRDVDKVATEFTVAPSLLERWRAWLSDDSYWPAHSVPTHGEVYPGHTLIRDNEIIGVIDWTTAAVGDPARDLMYQQAMASPEAFRITLDHYERGGGRTWPRLAEHCAEMFAANPVGYGLYAMEAGSKDHLQAAAAALNPEN